MSRSWTIAGLVSILTVGVLVLLVHRGQTLQASQLLWELPSTTRAVLHIDADALRRTAAAKTLVDAFIAEERLTEVEAVCGLDPFATLDEATLWVRGPEEQPFQSIGLMLRGRTVDAETLAECHRSLVEARGGSTVVLRGSTGPLLTTTDRRSAVALVGDRTIVTGSVQTVAEVMAVQRSGAPALAERARIAGLWPKVSEGASIAAVLDPPPHWKSALERITTLEDEAPALQGLETMALSVKRGSAQTVEVYVEIVDAALAAKNVAILRGWAEAPPPSVEPPWTDVVRSMRARADASTIVITLDVTSLSAPR